MGIDLLTKKLIPDRVSEFLRHHIFFNQDSINLKDLTLTIAALHRDISHPGRLGAYSRSIKLDRKQISEAKDALTQKDPQKPAHWDKQTWREYQKRRAYYIKHGEERWFKKYFPQFYRIYFLSNFWGSHKL